MLGQFIATMVQRFLHLFYLILFKGQAILLRLEFAMMLGLERIVVELDC